MSATWERFTPFDRTIITIAVMTATLLQVLDITIVNVALPHMQGSLGANPDEISWVLTSYLVSSAIFMPLTGYFTDRYGQKKFLMISVFGFIVASALCGAATSLTEIVSFRLLQGVFGAALVPLSQSILVDIYPPQHRSMAMAIWGVGVMVGPILGPTLGGYLTDVATWRWNFYINIPVGLISFLLILQFLPETEKKERGMDWIGLLLLSMGIAATQYFLDRGTHQDWFAAKDIQLAALLAVVGWVGFVLYSFYPRQNYVINLAIFKDRNFTVSSLLLGMFGLGLFGMMVIMPLMMENLLNYPVFTTGLAMAPRGISSMFSMILVGFIIKWVDERLLIAIGIILAGVGSAIGTYYNLDMGPGWIIGPLIIQGFGLGFIFATLSIIAFKTIPENLRAEASGVFSLVRTIGSSIGITLVTTIFVNHSQMAWNFLGGFINPYNRAVDAYLDAMNVTINDPLGPQLLGQELLVQSQIVALNDVFAFIAWSFVVMFFMLVLYKIKREN